ncbi:MAG: hypothetical protein GY927_00430 [bacterium]|nr:hypothetical protein [bacterium]
MLRKIKNIWFFGFSLFSMILFQSGPAFAQFDSDSWLSNAFVTPLPSKVKNGKSVTQGKSASIKALQSFIESGAFLSPSDVTNFSKSIESLVGNYFYIDKKSGQLQLLGPTFVEANKTVGIKDVIIFRAIVDRKFGAGAKVPAFLELNMKKDDLTELTVRSIATVIGNSGSNMVACNAPFGDFGANSDQLFYITAASVSMIYKKAYQLREQSGSGLISMLSLKGKNYFSNQLETRVPVISVSSIPVPSIPQNKFYLCAKYNDAVKTVQTAGLTKKVKVRSIRAVRGRGPGKQQHILNRLDALLSGVAIKGDTKTLKKLSGTVVGVRQ